MNPNPVACETFDCVNVVEGRRRNCRVCNVKKAQDQELTRLREENEKLEQWKSLERECWELLGKPEGTFETSNVRRWVEGLEGKVGRLLGENAELKAEVDRLKVFETRWNQQIELAQRTHQDGRGIVE